MEKLGKKELEKLIQSIAAEELINNNIKDCYVVPMTFMECMSLSYGLKEKIKRYVMLKKISREAQAFCCEIEGFNVVVMFLDNLLKMSYEDQILNSVFSTYHEVRHVIQNNFDTDSYDKFINDINHYNQYIDVLEYKVNHDSYSYEIGANIFALEKTKEYLKKNYPDVYELSKEKIDVANKKNEINYMSYPYMKMLNKALSKVMQNKDFEKIPVLKYFVNEYGGFKSVYEIKKSKEIEKLDKRIVYCILSSNVFIKSMNESELSRDDKLYLSEAIDYIKTIYINQKENFGMGIIDDLSQTIKIKLK